MCKEKFYDADMLYYYLYNRSPELLIRILQTMVVGVSKG